MEVQSQKESTFAKGMYQYHYRAFDLYEKPVISLAVLGDENASWSPSSYEYGLGGCRLSLEFPIVKLLNYQSRWQVLESSTNPCLDAVAHGGNPQDRAASLCSSGNGSFEDQSYP
ncbi:hypothetical protein BJP34_31010 [Moorena producens PAL-8-15-08-1]|uniref:Uncharacterized protein n=1 Tax=Moorena producens PAL-8-15-08-1 TaxID=1458985 RepID=A0A1D8U051_9CYAN|nr:hypothetical protein [Moorena producens]AOX03281.1 hypothetical protein BJP34_31010 [Moorena producens PAL-8-15-08-1]